MKKRKIVSKKKKKATSQKKSSSQHISKLKFGIPGIDKILKGGIQQGRSILLSGSPGAGKSVAAMQFLYNAAKSGEPGLYIASEESAKAVRTNAKSLGWDFEKLESEKKLFIYEQVLTESEVFSLETPLKLIKKHKIKRVVLDSLTLFQFLFDTDSKIVRRGIIDFIIKMKDLSVTLLATIERTEIAFGEVMNFSQEEFLFDILIILSSIRKGASYERVLHVAKTRGQDHLMDVYPITIGKGGMVVQVKEFPFSLVERKGFKK